MKVIIEAETEVERQDLEAQGHEVRIEYPGLESIVLVGRSPAGPVFRYHYADRVQVLGDLHTLIEGVRCQQFRELVRQATA